MKCYQKKQYRTKKFAKEVAKANEDNLGVKLWVYHCSECFKYHLTKIDPKKLNKIKVKNRIFKSKQK